MLSFSSVTCRLMVSSGGDLGAVVDQFGPDAYAVEFVAGSGRTQALVTLSAGDLRAVNDDDLLSVRSTHAIAS